MVDKQTTCSVCDGAGDNMTGMPCNGCGGRGAVQQSPCSGSAIDRRWLDRKGFKVSNGSFFLDYTDAIGDPAVIEYCWGDETASLSVPGEPWVAVPFQNHGVAERLLDALGVQ